MKRIVKVRYSPDFEKKKIAFMKDYDQYKKECNQRNILLQIEKVTSRHQLFEIKLYGYDKKLKWITNKPHCIPQLLSIIHHMPMGKVEKKSMNLYTDAHPETTIHGLGFKDASKAEYTLEKIQHLSSIEQYRIIQTMYQRAKYHPHQTKEMRDAMKLFHSWLKKYKKKKGGKSSLPYLPLSLINQYETLAEYYNISRKARGLEKPTTSDKGFLVIYREYKGDGLKMKELPCRKDKPEGVNWERKREIEVKGKYGQMKRMKIPLYHKEGELKDLPTKMHVNMIMWAYSPDKKGLEKRVKLLERIKSYAKVDKKKK
jgi:hypothetical protein